mmetsp:Transcript_39432/g.62553  ORF Transcript_39432/g.62553 Transcript_39432/m.62553 type:complete len:708 (-) Transcript_39432:42-2165(-)
MKSVIFVAMLCLRAASASGSSDGPVEKVVNLLTTLKSQLESDSKAEEQIYNKYACWCEKTSKRKAEDIVEATEDLRSLGQQILKLKGKIATRAAEIAELTSKIKSNEAEQTELTAVRQKENAAWAAESVEMKQALAALQQAITVLAKATTPKKGAELIQETQQMLSKQAIRSVLDSLPAKHSLPLPKMNLLSEFVTSKAKYAPQSATIQGMLSDMYLTFSNDLQSSTTTEADRNQKYEDLYASLEKENNELKATRERKEAEKAEAEASLADTTKTYDDTEKQMKADTEFFDETKAACESKHEEWTERSNLRSEEIDGISKALEILTDDKNRELFAKSIKPGVETFLQVASTPALVQDSTNAPSVRAYNAIKAQVQKSHSMRLAALAVRVRTAKFGHFEDVIKAIDEMIKTLDEEGAADLAKKTQCLNEYQKVTSNVNDLDWKIKNNLAKIDKLEKLIELRREEKAATIEKMDETSKYMKDITEERKSENEAYLEAKKEDLDSIELLKKARAAIDKYYKENGIKLGPTQGSVKLLQEDPAFEISEDQAPDATFSHKGSRKLQSKDVVSLLTYIIEDLQDEVTNEREAEAKAQAEYEEQMATAEKLMKELEAKKVTLTDIIAKRMTDKEEENKDMKANNGDRDAELSYEAKIKPDCDWIIKAFDGRAIARTNEKNGLLTAKEYLAGQVTLVEKSTKPDLTSIGFLGLSH